MYEVSAWEKFTVEGRLITAIAITFEDVKKNRICDSEGNHPLEVFAEQHLAHGIVGVTVNIDRWTKKSVMKLWCGDDLLRRYYFDEMMEKFNKKMNEQMGEHVLRLTEFQSFFFGIFFKQGKFTLKNRNELAILIHQKNWKRFWSLLIHTLIKKMNCGTE